MVRDGFFYALGLGVVAAALWYLNMPIALVALPIVLAAFFLWFFRDPNRTITKVARLRLTNIPFCVEGNLQEH